MKGWHSIQVDDDVMGAMKAEAEPFVDTPNSVLRRMFGLTTTDESSDDSQPADGGPVPSALPRRDASRARQRNGQVARPAGRRSRVPHGELLPEREYELPILKALDDRGGRGATREIVQAVGEVIRDKLRPLDRQDLNGAPRWHNRVQFARLGLVKEGFLEKGSPRGVWELSDAGRQRLKEAADS